MSERMRYCDEHDSLAAFTTGCDLARLGHESLNFDVADCDLREVVLVESAQGTWKENAKRWRELYRKTTQEHEIGHTGETVQVESQFRRLAGILPESSTLSSTPSKHAPTSGPTPHTPTATPPYTL